MYGNFSVNDFIIFFFFYEKCILNYKSNNSCNFKKHSGLTKYINKEMKQNTFQKLKSVLFKSSTFVSKLSTFRSKYHFLNLISLTFTCAHEIM